MTDKEKIRAEIERQGHQWKLCHSSEAKYRLEMLNELLDFIDSLQEKPIGKVWHDVKETPNFDRIVVFHYIDGVTSCQYCGQSMKGALGWAYLDDLLNLDNSCKISNDLQEPASDDLEKEITYVWNNTSDAFLDVHWKEFEQCARHFANWQKQQIEKNRLADCASLTEEQAEIEQDFVISIIEGRNSYPTYYDAIEYGMRLKEQQMLDDAVFGTVEESDPCQWQILSDDLEGEFVVKNNLVDGDRVKLIVIKED